MIALPQEKGVTLSRCTMSASLGVIMSGVPGTVSTWSVYEGQL